MGAGASTGKKGAKGVDGEALLKKAEESEAEATLLFEKIDKNKDGKLTKKELTDAVGTLKKDQKAAWSDELIKSVLEFFDRDGDGMLDITEFTFALAELKERGSFDEASLAEAKKEREAAEAKKAEYKVIFDEYAKDGGVWDKGSVGKLIRKLNDAENYWDDFGSKVTSGHATLTGSEERSATATFEQFVVWYPTLLVEIKSITQGWAADEAAAKAAREKKEADKYAPGTDWEVMMTELPNAINEAYKLEKTPILIDCTTPAGENKSAGFSPLENFYSYSGETLIELKKVIVDINVKKEKTIDEARDEMAKKLLLGLKQGRALTLLCSNSAPPLKSKFSAPRFPYEMLDATKLKPCLGDEGKLEGSFLDPVLARMKEQGLHENPSYSVVVAHQDFKVVIVTKFDPADYKGYLEDEFDMSLLQPIKVYTADK